MSVEANAYVQRPIAERASDPLHATVQELIMTHTVTGKVLDIGCSDGVSTWGMPDIDALGVDFNLSALQLAKEHVPGYKAVCGNIKNMPLSSQALHDRDTVVMLDILEHESWDDSTLVLQSLRKKLPPDHTVIASIPIFSPLSVETWRESLGVVKNRKRPDAGILDKTHKILTGRKKHHDLFAAGGYRVTEEYQTNHLEGVTGDWKWKHDLQGPYLVELLQKRTGADTDTKAVQIARRVTDVYMKATQDENSKKSRLARALFAYQGLYVAKPQV